MMSWIERHMRSGPALATGVFLLGLCIAALSGMWLQRDIELDARAEFQRNVERVSNEVSRRFGQPVYGLNGARGMYAAMQRVNRAEFRAYVQARDLPREFPGVRGFGFIQRTMRNDLDGFIASERADGAPDFTIRQLEDRNLDELYVIKFIEPAASNSGAQGLDVGSEARRRQAARRAVDSGEPTLTAAITLVQDQRRTPGMLLYVPVFANPASVSSAQERRTSLVGLLYAPIVIAELLDGLHEVVGRRVDFELFDAVGGTHQSSLVYDADGHVAGLAADRDPMLGRRFHSTSTLSLPGRDMTLRVSGTPQFEAAFTSSTPWLVFAVGVLASALLAALLWQQASGRRRAEAMALAMTADLDRLAQVVKYTSNAVSITDRQLRITWVNEGFTRISGYTLEEARGRTPGELLGSNKASPAALRTLEHSATTGTGCRVEILNRGKDGSEYWIDTEVQPLRDARGELTGFMEIGSDITARRLAQAQLEAALRENEALLRTIDIHAIVSVADRAGRITDANEAFSRISGYSRAELLGQNHRIVNSGVQPRSFWDEMWRTISGGAPWRGEVCNRAKDGSLYWVDTLIAPFQGADGQIEKYVSIRTDITASKHAEAEVQRSATLLRGAIDTIDEAFVLYDPDDRLVFCNDKYRSIYATSADLIVPGATFEQIVREGARRGQYAAAVGRVEEWVAQRMAAHRAGNTTLVQQMDDGRSVRIVERRMPDGHIVGFRIDITELVRATEAAQEASRAKSRFVANMSHEIRTPMNAILGMLALLRKTGLTARQADYATKTEGAARSLLELLNDMLDFSKVEADQMTLELQPFPVDQLLRDLSDILTIGVGSKKLELLFDIDPALPPRLVGDAMRLRQVLVNLGSNAVKFTEAGEVVLSVAVLQRGEDAVTLRIEVRDTGIGIAPQDQPRIFNSFTQAEASTTRRFGGTGLGVAISGRLVTLMGGELELESGLGQGSRFHFCITLPIAPDPAGDAPSEPVPAAPWRVLVAEANPTTRAVLQRMCGSLGWMVDLADSTQQAFSLLRTQHPAGSAYQAVLLAWQLPGPDCRQISKRIRALGLAGAAPIMVMVSAHGRELLAPQVEGEPDPVDGFLVKPFTASMLLNAVVDARGLRERALDPPAAHADGEQRLSGMRLLVVEDNLNNQQVARELLESEGATVRIANHGQQAVEMVASTRPPFDIVLMDLQMPVMDGFTAASRIRTNLGLLALPIVAMTANAMASDREACLAAGMNDHIGKPIDLDHLVQVLRQHAGRPQTPVGPLGAGAPELPAPVRQAAAAAGVEIDVALNRLGANRDIYQRLLRAFVASLTVMPDRLRAHVAQGQLVPASHLLHALKGQAATLGAPMLARAAAQGETDLSGANAPGQASLAAQQACSAIAGACPALGALLQALQDCDPPGAAIATAVDTRALLTQLRTLAELLQNADMAATDSMHAMQRQFGAASGASLRPLDEAITALDFEHALRLCTRLMAQLIESQPG